MGRVVPFMFVGLLGRRAVPIIIVGRAVLVSLALEPHVPFGLEWALPRTQP